MHRWPLSILVVIGCSSPSVQSHPPAPVTHPSAANPLVAGCAAPVAATGAPVQAPRGRAPSPYGEGLTYRETGATCQAARATLDSSTAAILAAPTAGKPGRSTAWDHRREPIGWTRVAQRLGLGKPHRALLDANGFVIAAGTTFWNYVEAYHEIFQSQLPIYVSLDSVMHAIFESHAAVGRDFEQRVLLPRVDKVLSTLACWLPDHKQDWPADVVHDLDVYLTVARALLADKPVTTNPEAAALYAAIKEATGLREIELFGRKRFVDFSAFAPRGYYTSYGLPAYFRAMMWLSRIDFNLVSRSSRSATLTPDPRETPHEVALALALVDAARGAGVLDEIGRIDEAWSALAGKRQDVSLAALDALRTQAGSGSLASAIGDGWRRTIPTEPHPDGETDLPVIAAMFGPRILADTEALAPIIQPSVPARIEVGPLDLAFILGHDRAKPHLAQELARFPNLGAKLGEARALLDAHDQGSDLYSSWLQAIRAIARTPDGKLPSYAHTEAYADLKMASAITAFGQLRHEHVLIGGMAYLGSGCEIPDGYVEPAVDVYRALIRYAERGAAVMAKIDPEDQAQTAGYWKRLASTLTVLATIAETELADRPLSAEQKRWLSMVVEIVMHDSSGAPPTYAGWYFDLFRDFGAATQQPQFVADYAFNASDAMYIGGEVPRMGVFVVDTGGAPRVFAGPIAHAFGFTRALSSGRMTDDDVATGAEPWSASYTVPATGKPALNVDDNDVGDWNFVAFNVEARSKIGSVTLELLDHHRVPISSITHVVGPGRTRFAFPIHRGEGALLHLKVGDFHDWARAYGDNGAGFYYLPPPP